MKKEDFFWDDGMDRFVYAAMQKPSKAINKRTSNFPLIPKEWGCIGWWWKGDPARPTQLLSHHNYYFAATITPNSSFNPAHVNYITLVWTWFIITLLTRPSWTPQRTENNMALILQWPVVIIWPYVKYLQAIFVQVCRSINVCHTTMTLSINPQKIYAKIVKDNGYGWLICDNAADTAFPTPTFCHITQTEVVSWPSFY